MTAGNRISAERVHEVLSYDPETGIFRWKATLSQRAVAECIAGGATSDGYVLISVDGHRYGAHRLAWLYITGQWAPEEIDHINGNRVDNRWANLRSASRAENAKNLSLCKRNTSGLKGVSWSADRRKWQATIMVDHKSIGLGRFNTKEEAAAAYKEAAIKYHGPFARQ